MSAESDVRVKAIRDCAALGCQPCGDPNDRPRRAKGSAPPYPPGSYWYHKDGKRCLSERIVDLIGDEAA